LAKRHKNKLFSSSFLPCFYVSAKLTKANKLFLYQKAECGKQLGSCYFFSLNGAPIHPALIGNSRGTKKNGRNLNRDHQFTLQVRYRLAYDAGCIVAPIYWRRNICTVHSFIFLSPFPHLSPFPPFLHLHLYRHLYANENNSKRVSEANSSLHFAY
jgi:hypothetical protein